MSPRASPMAPAERREALVAATVPLLRKHGREVTTRQIAKAAGVAEGTIFRVFATKEELVDAALDTAFAPGRITADLAAVDADLPLRERLLQVVTILQHRFGETFELMMKVRLVGPPGQHEDRAVHRERLSEVLVGVLGDDAERLRIRPELMMHVLRMLTFVGSHPQMSDGRPLHADEIVDLLLDGALERTALVERRTS